jgi:RNA polymerase sigma-70 factor (ECF subfamily)
MTPQGPETLADIYHQHRQTLFALARTVVGCQHLAEDAVHEAFAKLCRGDDLGRDPVAYTFAAVRNAAIDQLRKRHSRVRLQESLFNGYHVAVEAADVVRTAAENDEYELLKATVDRLDADQKQLVVLKIHAGLTFEQIGGILNVPLKTVATRYRRMLQKLAEDLKGRL